ncbi:response regulator [Candidatus Microgenomates bacterium]|nr:response regulator [Candidatus Microgenomates bacterium]
MDKKKKYRILLVEDDLFIRELYERVLIKENFDVISAIDGEEGLEKAASVPDIILLDIMMPKFNGIEILKKLKAHPPTKNIPIVLLTNLGQESIVREALKNGARGYLMKMRLSPYDLAGKVREFLANPHGQPDYHSLNLD